MILLIIVMENAAEELFLSLVVYPTVPASVIYFKGNIPY